MNNQAASPSSRAGSRSAIPSRRVRIFIVDDHALVREWLSNLLGSQPDLEVCGQAGDAKVALEAITAAPPDVVVVDLAIKGGSGLDLIKDLRDRCPSTQVVVLSMYEEIGYVERALRAGARAYVMKRESTGQIVEAIRQVREGRIFAGSDVLATLAARMVGGAGSNPGDPFESLSDREMEIFRRLGRGEGTRDIATELGLSIKTVQTYCQRLKEKLGIESGTELVCEAVRWSEKQSSQLL